MKHIVPLLLVTAAISHAEITVTVGEVSDKRTTGEFFAGLEIKLRLSGPELTDVRGLRVKVASATDDTGKSLVDDKKRVVFADEFKPLEEPFGPGPKKKGESEVTIGLANPPRAAQTVKLSGTLELISPKADPSSVVIAKLATDAGKPLDQPALKAAGVEITFKAPKGEELSYKLKDPQNKVASVEFCDAAGKPLKTNGASSWGSAGSKDVSVNVAKLPEGVQAKIYLLTRKSLVSVPLKMDAIKLP
ncbi:MAG: hypothetical protein WCP35_00910 [Verrucomicrobiota bacterium]